MSYFYWITGLSFAVLLASMLEVFANRNED